VQIRDPCRNIRRKCVPFGIIPKPVRQGGFVGLQIWLHCIPVNNFSQLLSTGIFWILLGKKNKEWIDPWRASNRPNEELSFELGHL
jgi:hypothetical protein